VSFSTLSCAVLAQATPGTADRRATLSDGEARIIWEKLMIVSYGETEEEALAHLRSHGMGEDGAKVLTAFRDSAAAELLVAEDQIFHELCDKKEEIRESGGPEMAAQMIEQSRRRTADVRRRLLAKADSLLTPEDQERLEHLYSGGDHGPNVSVTETNIALRVRSGDISLEQTITVACQRSNKKEK
jgi:hypothetical protein